MVTYIGSKKSMNWRVEQKEGKVKIECENKSGVWSMERKGWYEKKKGKSRKMSISGYYKELELEGLGYMFLEYAKKNELRFEGGYSHGMYLKYGSKVIVAADKKSVLVYGLGKGEVSNIKEDIKKLKKLEPYKGKGVRERGKEIKLKVGKKR